MIKLKDSKFTMLYEDVYNRYMSGGLISGDIVKFRKNALSSPAFKDLDESFKEVIKGMMESDLNLKVGAIKASRPGTQYDMNNVITGYAVDVVQEYAPGLYKNPVTVPLEVLERQDYGANRPPIPDSLRRKDRENFTPEKAPVRKQDPKNAYAPTGKVDKARNLTEAYLGMYQENEHHIYADATNIDADYALALQHNSNLTPQNYVDQAIESSNVSARDERMLHTWLDQQHSMDNEMSDDEDFRSRHADGDPTAIAYGEQ